MYEVVIGLGLGGGRCPGVYGLDRNGWLVKVCEFLNLRRYRSKENELL